MVSESDVIAGLTIANGTEFVVSPKYQEALAATSYIGDTADPNIARADGHSATGLTGQIANSVESNLSGLSSAVSDTSLEPTKNKVIDFIKTHHIIIIFAIICLFLFKKFFD